MGYIRQRSPRIHRCAANRTIYIARQKSLSKPQSSNNGLQMPLLHANRKFILHSLHSFLCVTSCVILSNARFSSIVVFRDTVERLSPMSPASL